MLSYAEVNRHRIAELGGEIALLARATLNPEKDPLGIGLTSKEVQSYSVLRAIGEIDTMRQAKQAWHLSGVEGEAHRELEKKHGQLELATSFYIPPEIQYRDLTAAVAGAGGHLVATTTGRSYIETLRNRSAIFRLGAQHLPGQRDNLGIPRQSAGATGVWLSNEGSTATESQQTVQQVAAGPKTVSAYTEISRLLTKQSNPAAEGLVMSDLAAVAGVALDADAINGPGGSGRPLGLLNTSGLGAFSGTTLALAALTEAQQDVLDANALLNPSTLGYASTPAVAKLLKNRQRFTGSDSPLWRGALHDGEIEGVRAISTKQIPGDTMIYGDWSQILVPEWGVLAIGVNPYANFPAGIIGVRVLWSVDVIFRHIESFSVATSIT
jgi:HK97 family phage major capsid protein